MKTNSSIVLLLLSVGLFYTFTNAQYQDVKELRAISKEYKGVLQNVANIIALRDQLIVTYNEFPQEEIERINKLLPENIDTVRMALDLDGMASLHDISIQKVQTTVEEEEVVFDDMGAPILPENAPPYQTVIVTISFVSTYEDFVGLLGDLEKNLRIMDIKSIAFRAEDEGGLYDFTVAVETYWLK